MKRRDVLKAISSEARLQGRTFVLKRQGANHELYSLDGLLIPIPRHNEINELTAEGILRECEPQLGKRWWK